MPTPRPLQLRGQRQQQRLAAGGGEQLGADRQAGAVRPAGTLIAGQPATFHGQAKGQAALAAVLVAQ